MNSEQVGSVGANLLRFALKPKPRNFLKALQSNAFKKFLLARLIAKHLTRN